MTGAHVRALSAACTAVTPFAVATGGAGSQAPQGSPRREEGGGGWRYEGNWGSKSEVGRHQTINCGSLRLLKHNARTHTHTITICLNHGGHFPLSLECFCCHIKAGRGEGERLTRLFFFFAFYNSHNATRGRAHTRARASVRTLGGCRALV